MKQRWAVGWVGALSCALLLAGGSSDAQSPSVEAKRSAARNERAGAAQPDQASHPDAAARKALERSPTTRQADAAMLLPAEPSELPEPDWRRQALDRYDWEAAFAAGGPPEGGLQLALGRSAGPFQPGVTYQLYLGVRNGTSSRLGLDPLSACGSLDRADGVWFRVASNTGQEVSAQLVYKDADDEHEHHPLSVDGGSSLRELVDLSHLAATSGELSDLLLEAARIQISAEIPALGLISNSVDIDVIAPPGTSR